ncbi:stimulated by retinoic acid gene 6 protein-like [Patiria miniata]|uniref:Receptor for retinol uptake STRA6 n=1 Tax=Patiria miniata TaxID=46514 RepID=A0A914B471_PATMI|nr:stimulated by retinoic acid gene 6 protein-like [Patiria miniata]
MLYSSWNLDTMEDYFGEDVSNMTTPAPVNPVCTYFVLRVWMLYSLIPAVAILILFCFLEKRVHLWPSFCGGRPGVAFPVNLVDSYTDRWSFAFAFGSMSTSMAEAIIGNQNILLGDYDYSQITPMLQGTVRFLVVIVNALIISVVFYPILLCLRSKKILGNILGLIYCTAWFACYMMSVAFQCDLVEGDGAVFAVIREFGSYGSGTICFLALMIRFLIGLVKNITVLLDKRMDSSKIKDFTMTHFYHRVLFLLTPPTPKVKSTHLLERLFQRFIGTVPGFRFSRHNICTLVLSLVTTTQVALVWTAKLESLLFESGDPDDKTLKICFWITCVVSLVLTFVFTIDMQLRYRRHTLKLWRGDRSFCPEKKATFDNMMGSSLYYTGYHVAFTAWGFLVLQVLLWALVFLIITFKDKVLHYIKLYWLTIIITGAFYYSQIFLSRIVFLQRAPDREQSRIVRSSDIYLGLDNRRIFHVTIYITLFINFLVGLLSCFFRIFIAIVLETVFIGRLDRCTLMRGWESWDQGFRSYVGFLELEVAHTHPVVITFCHFILLDLHKRKRRLEHSDLAVLINNAENGSAEEERLIGKIPDSGVAAASWLKSRQVRNKWLVALTLARNPELVIGRKLALLEAQHRQRSRNSSLGVSQTVL